MKEIIVSLLLIASVPLAGRAADVSPADMRAVAEETYIWGYPLVMMDTTRKAQTNVAVPGRAWLTWLHLCRPLEPCIDRTWPLRDIEKVK